MDIERFKLKIIVVCVFFVGSLLGSCSKKEDVTYYENGVIKSRMEMASGRPHGVYRTYFPSGNLAISGVNFEGKKNGIENSYYESGTLKQVCEWKDGMLNGFCKKFTDEGHVFFTATFSNGKQIGAEDWYDLKGRIFNRNLYDSHGNCVYILQWDSVGNKTYSRVVPIVQLSKDTIGLYEQCKLSIHFGYRLTGKLDFEIESLESVDAPRIQIERDTLEQKYTFDLTFDKPGLQKFAIFPTHVPLQGDTLSADGYGKEITLQVLAH